MVSPILVADFSAGTSAQVYTMLGAKVTALGDSFSLTEAAVPDGNFNCVIHAFGGVYCYTKDGVFKLQGGLVGTVEDTWSSDSADGGFAFPNTGGAGTGNVGIYYTVIDDEPYLFGIYPDSSTQYRVWRYNLLTETYEESSSIAGVAGSTGGWHVYYNGLIIGVTTSNNGLIVDPSSLNISTFSNSSPGWSLNISNGGADFNVFNGELYMLHRASSGSFPSISKFGGGTFSRELILQSDACTAFGSRVTLFDDGTNMYAMYYQDFVFDGWRCFEITISNGILSLGDDVGPTVFPPGLQIQNNQTTNASRMTAYKSPLSDGTYEILIWYAPNNTGGSFEQYLWNGPNAQMSLQDLGGDSQYQIASTKYGGGDRIFDQDAPSLEVYARARVAGGEEITFRCFGGQTDQVVRFYIGSGGGTPETQAQLTGTATGGTATRNGNQVESVDCDGVTDYTIAIIASTFDDNERVELTARISDS